MMISLVIAGKREPKSVGSIDVVSLTPEAGSSVDRNTVITVELRYSIDNFQTKQNRYAVSINFQKRDSRTSTFSSGPGDAVVLKEASGTVTLTYPLESIWDNPKLRKPVVVYFYLHERTGRHQS